MKISGFSERAPKGASSSAALNGTIGNALIQDSILRYVILNNQDNRLRAGWGPGLNTLRGVNVDDKTAARMRPTLKSIANITGLGITTVSRALKDAPDIGADTKERVRRVARELGYHPNRAGVRLRTGKTYVISLIMSLEEEVMGLTSPVVVGISEVLAGTPYHLLVMPYKKGDDPVASVRYILETGAADGLIISRTKPDDPRVSLLVDHGLPFVTHGRTTMDVTHPFHDFDNEAFAYEAVRRIAERGRRRIALLPPPSDLTYYGHVMTGFGAAIRAFGLSGEVMSGVDTDKPLGAIRDICATAFADPNGPDAVISCAGSTTTALIAGLEQAGRRIGHDIDVVSKVSNDVLGWLRPEVITIREDFRLAGRELAKAVLARIEGCTDDALQSLSTF